MNSTSFEPDWQWPTSLPGRWSTDESDEKPEAERTKAFPKTETSSSSPSGHSQANTTDQSGSRPRRTHYGPRQCRICLETVQPTYEVPSENIPEMLQGMPSVSYVSEDGGRLLRPCLCKGSQKYVHEGCLAMWRLQDPNSKRNYWQCPTCKYSYRLGRMTWAYWIRSTATQLALTALIFLLVIFLLGFVADPILDLLLGSDVTVDLGDYQTFTDNDGGVWQVIDESLEESGWLQHLVKGFASLGLLGCAKLIWTMNPFSFFNIRHYTNLGGGGIGGSGRQRIQGISWYVVLVGIVMFLWVSLNPIHREHLTDSIDCVARCTHVE